MKNIFNKSLLIVLIPAFMLLSGCDEASKDKINTTMEQTKDKATDLNDKADTKASELSN